MADMLDNAIAHAVQNLSIARGHGARIANAQSRVARVRNIEPIQSRKKKIVAVRRVRMQTVKNNTKIATWVHVVRLKIASVHLMSGLLVRHRAAAALNPRHTRFRHPRRAAVRRARI